MSKFLLFIFLICTFLSCSKKQNKDSDNRYELRNIYIEAINLPDSISSKFIDLFENKIDTVYNFYKGDSNYIIYKFKDARDLPTANLLNHTRKVRFTLYNEKDSVGNPYYSYSLYESDNSEWRRTFNFGKTSFREDTIVNDDFILETFRHFLSFNNWKGLP